jgi:purine-binding chemotaxis protein CheW
MSKGNAPPEPAAAGESHVSDELAGKYMTFKVAKEEYGLPILKVRELIGHMEITRAPGAPSYLRGVINLRGKVIPVVDLSAKFGMGTTVPTDQTVIIVVQHARGEAVHPFGVMVDELLEVVDLTPPQIDGHPGLHTAYDFVLGLGKLDKRIIFLIDIDRAIAELGEALPTTT